MIKPQILKGFRDFLPGEKRKRDWVTGKVVEIFSRFGFEPLETPTLEYASLLLGKYGEEADKLVYKFKDKGDREIALRYDQTVPTARIIAQYYQKLPKYFRRYQIQNVFRADKPQKNRYREFTQCDIDIFGSTNPISDAEILACTYFAFKNIGFPTVKLKLNDRETLLATNKRFTTDKVNVFSIIQTLDKLDRLPKEKVIQELVSKGLTKTGAEDCLNTLYMTPLTENLSEIMQFSVDLGVSKDDIIFDPKLARGLDYYTGMIFEVSVPEYSNVSLGGGGRYDRLIKQLGDLDIPAVGIAFGFDRMVEAASQLNLIYTENLGTKILVTIFDPSLVSISAKTASILRTRGLSTELYVNSTDKIDKQFKYADRKGLSYVVIIGPEEMKNNRITLKDLQNRNQITNTLDEILKIIK